MATSIWNPLVRTFIRRSLDFGWSGNRIYNSLPDIGLPKYHKATFLKVVSYEREYLKVGKATIEYPKEVPFPKNLMVEEFFPMTTRYRLHGKAIFYDTDLDIEYEQDIQMYAEHNLGKGKWEQEFIDRYEPRYGEEDIEVVSVHFEKVVHQPGFRY